MNDKFIAHATIYDDEQSFSQKVDYTEYFEDVDNLPDIFPLDCLEKEVPNGHWVYGWLESIWQSDRTSSLMGMWEPVGEFRVKAFMELPDYDPQYGNDRVCVCGHKYREHFSGVEDLKQTGCKECGIHAFKEKVE